MLTALKVLAVRLRHCAEFVEILSLSEVGQRLARLLLAEASARGRRSEQGLEVTLTMTSQQIASVQFAK